MKVLRIYFNSSMESLGHKSAINSGQYDIKTVAGGYLINSKVFIPTSSCKEVIIVPDPEPVPAKSSNRKQEEGAK